ncbi:MAG: MFS transporter, partial [Geminicoccaceae bacterium]
GGAAIYVAEHAPDGKRGLYTSWIQTTATIGMFAALGIILATRVWFGDETYRDWGWRVPFLISAVLVAGALYIRARLQETPLFQRIKDRGQTAKNTAGWARDSFSGNKIGVILLVLIGMTAGQAVVWYQGQFQALFFLTVYLKSAYVPAYTVLIIAIALATPFFIFFGWLSDKIGRKPVILGGCLIAAITYVPIYMGMKAFSKPLNWAPMILLLCLQMVYVTMVYGPIAAFLVELFPTNVRYTSMSVPYHFGNGWFGGFLPLIATALTASAWAKSTFGDNAIYAGLIFPIAVALLSVIVNLAFIRETKDHQIDTPIRTA